MADCDKSVPKSNNRTIENLRLDIDAATAGKTWLLLPDGFRDQDSGRVYPLPSRRHEVMKVAGIPLPERKMDSGCIYILRCIEKMKESNRHKQSAVLDLMRMETKIADASRDMNRTVTRAKEKVRQELEQVRMEAAQAIANLSDLFALGRKGLDGQMRAHLEGSEWQGEKIDARAFRECFRMVSQAVKGLGLPSEQRLSATDAVMDEVAAALKETQSAIAMDTEDPDETSH